MGFFAMDQFLPMILQLGAGALTGVAIGFALRKIALFLLFLVGCGILFTFVLTQWGVATVNWSAFDTHFVELAKSAQQWATHALKGLSIAGVGFMGGVLVGWRLR
jgi:uncharacterized membrane protein (Fun14 family)